MYRAFQREPSPRNLGSVLTNIDIAGWYLHNAGNDAVYTLQAMIAIAMRAMLEKLDDNALEEEMRSRVDE
jgi:hypothetical protein